mmetsp:Transcript_117890/g.345386  ORF Transcript_117890/g.345386 Transcript_117890/m.345386 type:complete len:704 (+) Transcript_117890:2-2113(+)
MCLKVQHAATAWRAKAAAEVQQGLDLDTARLRSVLPGELCEQVGELVRIHLDDYDDTHLLRMRISPKGWVTLAQRGGACIEPFFQDHAESWAQLFSEAHDIDALAEEAAEYCAKLDAKQEAVREAARTLGSPMDSSLLRERDEAREAARRRLEDYLALADQRCFLPGWCGSGSREEARAALCQDLEKIQAGMAFSIKDELEALHERRQASRLASVDLEQSICDLKKARILQVGDEAIEARQNAYRACRERARRDEKLYSKAMERARRCVLDHAPELLPDIVHCTDDRVRSALTKLTSAEQSNVLQVLSEDRQISHYDQVLEEMRPLSKANSRHVLKQTTYDSQECVLKMFDLGDNRGLESWIKEIELHVKLKSAHVVPLQRAFIDSFHGFLQFNLYRCDLTGWIQRTPRRHRHRLGEPAEAGMEDCMQEVHRVVQGMIQSVSHIHSHGVTHGDLKPSNWLMSESDLPMLCDFETAKEQGGGCTTTVPACSTTRPKLHTPEYTAPERRYDPTHPPTKQADMFSLGMSIQRVLACASNYPVSPYEELKNLADAMVDKTPNQRISALDAENICWACSGRTNHGGLRRQVWCRDVDVFYTQSSCGGQFSDGKALNDLIEAVVRDPAYALNDKRLELDVVKKGRALMCVNNRRLHCFHRADERIKPKKVYIWIRQYNWEPIWERYFRNLDANNRGKDISVRRKAPTHR